MFFNIRLVRDYLTINKKKRTTVIYRVCVLYTLTVSLVCRDPSRGSEKLRALI